MKTSLLVAFPVAAILTAAPAFAGPKCAAAGDRLPMWQVARSFEEQGGQIQQMKISDGCYEIYGTEGQRRVEIYFDPRNGAVLERESE